MMLNIPVTMPLSGDTEFMYKVLDDLHKVGVLAGIREYRDANGQIVREVWRQQTPLDKKKKKQDNWGGVIVPDKDCPLPHEFIKYNMPLMEAEL